jgi:hypothetical protein
MSPACLLACIHSNPLPAAALWASVFNFASELDLAHDAYTAALSNPLPERAAESVRRLVQALVDRSQLQQLLSLPWSGVLLLNRSGLKEPVPVVEVGVVNMHNIAWKGCFSYPACKQVGGVLLLTRNGLKEPVASACC